MLPVAMASANMGLNALGGSSILSSIGSFLGSQAGGNILSTVTGGLFGGKKKKTPSFQEQVWMNQQMEGALMEARMGKAKELGIHPLVALGIPPSGGGGWTMGGNDNENRQQIARDMGQNISSAIHHTMSADERAISAKTALQLVERGDLENELLKSQIMQIRSNINPAPYNGSQQLIDGQAQSGTALVPKQIYGQTGDGMEVGLPAGLAEMKYKGSKVRIPGKAWADANLDDGPASWQIQLMNTVPDLAKAEIKNFFKGSLSSRTGTRLGDRIADALMRQLYKLRR